MTQITAAKKNTQPAPLAHNETAQPAPLAHNETAHPAQVKIQGRIEGKITVPKLAWAISGSGHYFVESLDILKKLSAPSAGGQVGVKRYAQRVLIYSSVRPPKKLSQCIARNSILGSDTTTASDADGNFTSKPESLRTPLPPPPPVGKFYHGEYHGLVLAPATSNTIAKCVYGISDNLVTNVFAQAGKCRVPIIVFACDTAPEMESEAPGGMVKLWPRKIDLDNVEKLKSFENTVVVSSLAELSQALEQHYAQLAQHFPNLTGTHCVSFSFRRPEKFCF